jgi:hypothetical protein
MGRGCEREGKGGRDSEGLLHAPAGLPLCNACRNICSSL